MDVAQQIDTGVLVCPKTKQKLHVNGSGDWLENSDKTERYPFAGGNVPVLLLDSEWAQKYVGSSQNIAREYSPQALSSLVEKMKQALIRDYRTTASQKAFDSLFHNLTDSMVLLSVGGGPQRAHEKLTNLNIGPFPNVDVVADAHCLPYADNSVDIIYCEAVFEHLHTPVKAAHEMFRALRPGGKAFVCTPFLQPYHGYPSHYQNYTLTGHTLLFESAGFRVVEAGPCVGPVFTIMQMGATFIRYYLPRPFNQIFRFAWSPLGMAIRPLDKILGKSKSAYIMASTTYAVIEKP